jgi:acyl carrier protein
LKYVTNQKSAGGRVIFGEVATRCGFACLTAIGVHSDYRQGPFQAAQALAFEGLDFGCAFDIGWRQQAIRDEDQTTMSDVAERVRKIVVEHLGVDADKVVDDANFIEDLGADSLDTVELVMAFEEEFGVEIPDDAAESIVTVGDAIRFLDKATAS